MPIATSGSTDIELLCADGVTWLPLQLALNEDDKGRIVVKSIEEALVGSDAAAPLSEWLESIVQEDWSGGIGVDYDVAPGCDTWSSAGYVLPGGASTDVTLPATNNSSTPIVAMGEYGTDLFVAQRGDGAANTARVMRSVGGTGALADSLTLGANEYMRDLVLFDDGSGNTRLWASSSSITGDSGRLHAWDGAAWTSTAAGAFGTNGRNRMARVFWRGNDGVGDWRLVTMASFQGHISYLKAGGSPSTPADWVELVKTGTSQGQAALVAARHHVYINADNLYDLDEIGDSPSLSTYSEPSPANGLAAEYLNGYVYRSLAMGLDRVRVDQAGVLQENPGVCSPGWGTPAISPWLVGYTTALATHQGCLLNAVYSPGTGRSGVFRGIDREIVGVKTPNPLVWHGPEAINAETAIVTKMWVTNVPSEQSRSRLYLATWHVNQSSQPKLAWVSMPSFGTSYASIAAGSVHKFASGAGSGTWQQSSRLELLPQTVGDKASRKFLNDRTYGSINLSGGTKFTVYARADPSPSSTSWGTGVDVATSPTTTVTSLATVAGNKLQDRIDFFSPNGSASTAVPAVLDSLRTTYWRAAPDVDTWTFDVEYGPGIVDLANTPFANAERDIDWHTDQLKALCRSGRTTMRDRQDRRWIVKVKQTLPRLATLHESEYGKTVRAKITLAVLEAAA